MLSVSLACIQHKNNELIHFQMWSERDREQRVYHFQEEVDSSLLLSLFEVLLETNEFNDKRYVIAERLCLYWAVLEERMVPQCDAVLV